MSEKQYYVDRALQLGADHAVLFTLKDIVFDSRTILKCMFGCADWGKGHTCPSRPGSLKPWEYQKVFSAYKWGVIVHQQKNSTRGLLRPRTGSFHQRLLLRLIPQRLCPLRRMRRL